MSVLFCSALLALITHTHWHKPDGKRFYWLGLTILFVFLALDEGTAIHEAVGTFLEDYMDAQGTLYFLWVVPYGIATAVPGLAYLRFVWELPTHTRARFVTAGVIFLTGALGIEMFGAREADFYGDTTVTYCVLYSLEEMLEMLGIILFIYAPLSHLAQETGRLSLVLGLAHDPLPRLELMSKLANGSHGSLPRCTGCVPVGYLTNLNTWKGMACYRCGAENALPDLCDKPLIQEMANSKSKKSKKRSGFSLGPSENPLEVD